MSRARPRARLASALLGATLALPAAANPHRLDDAQSYTVPPNVQMQWLPLKPGQPFGQGMEAWLRVNVRIDTRQWAGRSGRVYMVLPSDQASRVEAVWTTQGRLLAGRLLSGERALVYAGPIPGPTLQDQLQVHLRANPDWTANSRRLDFHFELDVD